VLQSHSLLQQHQGQVDAPSDRDATTSVGKKASKWPPSFKAANDKLTSTNGSKPSVSMTV
jgi:hypothetical protein